VSIFGEKLSGVIPTTIGYLTSLKELVLSDNQLSGVIPSAIGNLTNLQILILTNNLFEIRSCVKLVNPSLISCQIDGIFDCSCSNITGVCSGYNCYSSPQPSSLYIILGTVFGSIVVIVIGICIYVRKRRSSSYNALLDPAQISRPQTQGDARY